MDTLHSMRTFARIVELGGFSAAARSLRMSPAMATKHVASLERRLGVSLLTRTTRKVAATEAGVRYYERCVEVLRAADDADALVSHEAVAPSGVLRITAPVELGNAHIAPMVAALVTANPELAVHLELTNRVIDLAEEGLDAAIRVAPALDTAASGRQLATSRLLVVASPAYLAAHGRPRAPADLARHAVLCFSVGRRDRWRFARGGSTTEIQVAPRVTSSSSEALRQAACDGAGIVQLPTFVAGRDLADGRLVPLFTAFDTGHLKIHVVYPQRRFHPARLRVLVDALLARFGVDPERDPFWPAAPAGEPSRAAAPRRRPRTDAGRFRRSQ